MSARKGIYVLLCFNLLYIGALVACTFLIGGLHPPDFVAMRSKIASSPSVEDLRPRALHAISAIESADQAIEGMHGVAIRLVWLGVTWAVVNSLVIYLLVRHINPA